MNEYTYYYEYFTYISGLSYSEYIEQFNDFDLEDKRAVLSNINLSYVIRRAFVIASSKQVVFKGISLEDEFAAYEYKYRLGFQTEICLLTSAQYLYNNIQTLNEYTYYYNNNC